MIFPVLFGGRGTLAGAFVHRFGVRPLPVGYRLSVTAKIRVGSQPVPAVQS